MINVKMVKALSECNGEFTTPRDILWLLNSFREEGNTFDVVFSVGHIQDKDFISEREIKEDDMLIGELHADCVIYSFEIDIPNDRVIVNFEFKGICGNDVFEDI